MIRKGYIMTEGQAEKIAKLLAIVRSKCNKYHKQYIDNYLKRYEEEREKPNETT